MYIIYYVLKKHILILMYALFLLQIVYNPIEEAKLAVRKLYKTFSKQLMALQNYV
jgi:hypothetical protein